MTATFRINQDSVNGTWGLARTNLELFSAAGSVTLEAQDTHATYLWEIIGNIDGSSGVLSASTAQVTTIDMDVEGTLIIRLTVDAAIPVTKDIQELAVGIPLPNSGLVLPGARETIQDNQYTGADAGWYVKFERLMKWLDANSGGTLNGVSPTVVDAIATWSVTDATEIQNSPHKAQTILETIESTPNHPVRYIKALTSAGSNYATLLRYFSDEAGANLLQIGDESQYGGLENKLHLTATVDPLVQIIGVGIGALLHENMTTVWNLEQRGRISHASGDAVPALELQNTGTNSDLIGITVGSGGGTPEGRISALPGSLHIDGSSSSNAKLYQHRGASSGTTGWVEVGAGDLSGYLLLVGRSGGQTAIGGTGTTDSLVLQSTSATAASGANIDFNTGADGATNAMRIQYDGKVGINTASPDELFDVGGVATIDSNGKFRFVQAAATDYDALAFGEGPGVDTFTLQALLAGSGDANTLNFKSGVVANILTMTAVNGRVGIKKGTPDEVLHVGGNVKIDGDIILYLGGTILSSSNGDIVLDPNGTGITQITGDLKVTGGDPVTGKRLTDSDGAGLATWEAGVHVVESRATTLLLDDDDEELFITDGPITVDVPSSGQKAGKTYWIKNCCGISGTAGDTNAVTLDILGSTVKFNGEGNAIGNTFALATDGDWAKITYDPDFGSVGTWWIMSNLQTSTGSTA
ncbi:MAG: hypothetical protein GY841_22240 [FCB group bacterium]|nr:hypothetical protein [FCB group bacterium]